MQNIASTGEILDLIPINKSSYLAYSTSGVFVALIIIPNLSTYLYTCGGFMLPSAVVAIVALTPLLCLPRISEYLDGETEEDMILNELDLEVEEKRQETLEDTDLSFVGRYFIYYLPDLVTFIQNAVFQVTVYALPLRLKRFNNIHETTTTWMITSEFLMSFVSSMFITKIHDRTDIIGIMILGTFMFYGGSFLAVGYSTVTLKVWGGAVIGMMLFGLADPSYLAMVVMSKFYIYRTLGKTAEDMGETASRSWKVGLNAGALLGGVLAGYTTTRESEEWIFWVSGCAGIVCAASLCTVWVYLRINKSFTFTEL